MVQGGIGCFAAHAWHLALAEPVAGEAFTLYDEAPRCQYVDQRGRLWFATVTGRIRWLDTTQQPLADPFAAMVAHNQQLEQD